MDFTQWLKEQIKLSGFSMRLVSQRAKISHATLSRVLSGKQSVTRDFCASIARGLGLSEYDVLIHAGLLREEDRPATTFTEPGMNELVEFARTLSDGERYQFLNIMRALHEGRVGLYVAGQPDDAQTSNAEGDKVVK